MWKLKTNTTLGKSKSFSWTTLANRIVLKHEDKDLRFITVHLSSQGFPLQLSAGIYDHSYFLQSGCLICPAQVMSYLLRHSRAQYLSQPLFLDNVDDFEI